MFHKTIDALKATEAAATEELNALFVPFDPATGSGGVHWHAAGAGILQNAIRGITGLREELEKRQGPIDEAQAAAEKAEADAAQAAQEQADREAAAAAPVNTEAALFSETAPPSVPSVLDTPAETEVPA